MTFCEEVFEVGRHFEWLAGSREVEQFFICPNVFISPLKEEPESKMNKICSFLRSRRGAGKAVISFSVFSWQTETKFCSPFCTYTYTLMESISWLIEKKDSIIGF